MKKKVFIIFSIVFSVILFLFLIFNLFLFPKKYRNYITFFSKKYEIDIALIYSIIKTESNFNEKAISSLGAKGLMQLIPSTAKWIASELKIDFEENMLFDAEVNINFGCFYLNYLFLKFESIDAIICAYNAGETVVRNWLDENGNLIFDKISYNETKNYLKRVKKYYRIYSNSEIGV